MRPVLILLRKSLLSFWRSRTGALITFLVPIGLIYLFGHIFNLHGGTGGPSGIPVAVVNQSAEPMAAALVDALKADTALRILTTTTADDGSERPLTEADVRRALHDNHYRFALVLPPDFLSESGFGLKLKFLSNPRNEIETQTVNGLLQKTIFTNVPQLLGQSLQRAGRNHLGAEQLSRFNRSIAETVSTHFGGDPAVLERRIAAGDFFSPPASAPASTATADPALRRLDPAAADPAASSSNTSDFLSRLIAIETEQVAGRETKNPMAARLVGGYAIMFLLFAVSNSAATFFEERNTGVFQRLLSSPVRPAHIVWARFLFGVVLGLLQIFVLFLAGRLFYGLDIVSHAGALFFVAFASAAACSAFGLLITAFSSGPAASSGLSTLVVLSMSAIGGAWFPVSFMPDYIQTLSKFTLVYWSVEGFTDVLWAGRSLFEVLPKIGVLFVIALGVMGVTVWRFGRRNFFE